MTTFDTAILYDIENLIGGYASPDTDISLTGIHTEVAGLGVTQRVAIQRAYANWSDPRLRILQGDVLQLGIEPVQMFGFGRGPNKNASDIQLAIDAIELALLKPWITTFVIVSGDGGFSFLAKKLHEHGRTVVGCADNRAVNRVFRAVCDHFVHIDAYRGDSDPGRHRTAESGSPRSTDASGSASVDLLAAEFRKAHPRQSIVTTLDDLVAGAREVLSFLSTHKEYAQRLRSTGVNVSIFRQLLGLRVDNPNFVRFGLDRLSDFIAWTAEGSPCDLVFQAPSEYRLVGQGVRLRGYDTVAKPASLPEVHSEDYYRKILARGAPIFRDINGVLLRDVTDAVLQVFQDTSDRTDITDLMDRIEPVLSYDRDQIKAAIMSLVNGDCFEREPPDTALSAQTLRPVSTSRETLLNQLHAKMGAKIISQLDKADDSVLRRLFW